MSLIPSISLTDFKKLKPAEIAALKSCEVTLSGEHLFTAVIPPREGGHTVVESIRARAEELAMTGNAVGGQAPQVIKTNSPSLPSRRGSAEQGRGH